MTDRPAAVRNRRPVAIASPPGTIIRRRHVDTGGLAGLPVALVRDPQLFRDLERIEHDLRLLGALDGGAIDAGDHVAGLEVDP